jgi:hypothetical protein
MRLPGATDNVSGGVIAISYRSVRGLKNGYRCDGSSCTPDNWGVMTQSNSFWPRIWSEVRSNTTRSSAGTRAAHGTTTTGRGSILMFPMPLMRSVRTAGSPTRGRAGATAASIRSSPTAPKKSTGRFSAGTSRAISTRLSVRSTRLSSRLKKL